MRGEGRVLLIGDACVDIIIQVPSDERSSTGRALEPTLCGGGTVANTAVALARLGVPTSIVAAVGDDVLGRFVADGLACEGVDTTWLHREKNALTPPVLAMIDPDGRRTAIGLSSRERRISHLSPEMIQPEALEGIAWLHTSGVDFDDPVSRETILRGIELASARGIPVSIDLNLRNGLVEGRLQPGFRLALERAIERADVVFGSAHEEFVYLADGDSPEAVVRGLAGRKRTVVARLGEDGAFAVSERRSIHSPAFEVAVVDTLGAGDVFNGGFIAARIEGRSLEEALRWSNAVAGLTITKRGARSTPHREEVERLLNKCN